MGLHGNGVVLIEWHVHDNVLFHIEGYGCVGMFPSRLKRV